MARRVALLLLAPGAFVWPAKGSTGRSSCPCIANLLTDPKFSAINQYRSGSNLVYQPAGSTRSYTFADTYGQGSCSDFDKGLPPLCHGDSTPAWCKAKWCYVDPDNCDGVAKVNTRFFLAVENLYFSYGTCVDSGSSSNTVSQWNSQDVEASKKMIEWVEGYTRAARWTIEDAYKNYDASSTACQGGVSSMCPCDGCTSNGAWNNRMSFLEVGMLEGTTGTAAEREQASCLSLGIATTFQRVAAKEADANFARVGYQYFADQATGSYTQWPKMDMCDAQSSKYDPRARPWYAAGATGPKDVVIVVDVSGSMAKPTGCDENCRHKLAKEATKAILETLTWKDFATIILFNHGVASIFSESLVPVTDQNRAAMQGWCDQQSWAGGGTNFRAPMQKAFDVIANSVAKGDTSMCQKAIMFLTDGVADFSEADFTMVRTKSVQYDTVVFAYALGDGAEKVISKRLACENRGVYYHVPDGGDLSHIMSSYYEYFSHGQEICSASFIRYAGVGGGHTLYAGCMSMYDRTKPSPELLGVSCMDLNMMADIRAMQSTPGWKHFTCVASDMTKMCRQVDLTECHRQKIRQAYSQDSVCTDASYSAVRADTTCPCTDQSCQDDPGFTDEKNYFCDTWVGDSCDDPNPTWGYSQEGLAEIRRKCPRSCGKCAWSSGACGRAEPEECPVIPVPTECRACLGRTSGVDIDQRDMQCPPDSPRDLSARWATTTTNPSASGAGPGC